MALQTKAEYTVQAIRNLRPNSNFTLIGQEFSDWEHENSAPTWEEIQDEIQNIKDSE